MPATEDVMLAALLAEEERRKRNARLRQIQDLLFLVTGQRPRLAFSGADGESISAFESTFQGEEGFFNVPTMFRGEILDPLLALSLAEQSGMRDPQTGASFPVFGTQAEAVQASKARSKRRVRSGRK
jgi:hypothetical protein